MPQLRIKNKEKYFFLGRRKSLHKTLQRRERNDIFGELKEFRVAVTLSLRQKETEARE